MEQWIPQQFTNQQRLAIAKEICEKLKNKYGDGLRAVAVEGSTAKGLDSPRSDLELKVVATGQENRWHAFFCRGMFVGISYESPEEFAQGELNIDYHWPVVSDALHTAKVLYDPGNIYANLRAKALAKERVLDFTPLLYDALTDMYENVLKLFCLTAEQSLAAPAAAAGTAYWAAMAVALANRHRYLSSRNMYGESFALPDLPSRYRRSMETLLAGGNELPQLQSAAGELWCSFVVWAKVKGICLDDDELARL